MKEISQKNVEEFVKKVFYNNYPEGIQFDYKQEWYHCNIDALIDITCFANSLASEFSFIIIGISDDHKIIGVDESISLNDKQDWLKQAIDTAKFSGEYRPEFKSISITLDKKRIDVIVIQSSSRQAPYFLAEERKDNKTKKSMGIGIYTRNLGQNTSQKRNADRPIVEQLWRHHFEFDKKPTPEEELRDALENIYKWKDDKIEDGFNVTLYYVDNPAFALFFDREPREGDQYQGKTIYQVIQTNSSCRFSRLKILMWNRALYEFEMRWLDGGVIEIPTPGREFISYNYNHTQYTFKYYLLSSIDYSILKFNYLFDYNSEKKIALRKAMKLIDIYENEDELNHFIDYLQENREEYEKEMSEISKDPYLPGTLELHNNSPESQKLRREIIQTMAAKNIHLRWRSRLGFPELPSLINE